MFHRDDNGTHTDIGKHATKDLTATLPAGIYRFARSMMGLHFLPQTQAADRFVEVPAPEMEAVRQECSEFFDPATRARATAYGQLNKRGILLYGPHGTGKTRLMLHIMQQAAATHGAVVLNDVDPDNDLTQAVEAIRRDDPERLIVVLWDEFDQKIRRFEPYLLRWLDGVDSVDNIMFVGCTNHIEKVPQRIYARPSRFGLVQYIGPVSLEARAAFIRGSYPEITDKAALILARLTEGQSLDLSKEVALLHVVRGHSPEQIAERHRNFVQGLGKVGIKIDPGALTLADPQADSDDDDDDDDTSLDATLAQAFDSVTFS